ncbi:MAG: type I-F CRISPR-associated endoribonuclease Cas6/Csy4 [Conchiformibius sp.]|nr:type I-F CRISPR-associated endoribonuclease Cas6/Csy4 [Conchiformibius sp.]
MLSHYFELKAIPQADMLQNEVTAHLWYQLHCRLPAYGGRIGLAFPAYGIHRGLGGIIRLFGSQDDLHSLHTGLNGLQDYALISPIQTVPATNRHLICQRIRPAGNSSFTRARKRWQAQNLPESEIIRRLQDWAAQIRPCTLPYAVLPSSSTGQRMNIFVRQTETDTAYQGNFNHYGLSSRSTVPHF